MACDQRSELSEISDNHYRSGDFAKAVTCYSQLIDWYRENTSAISKEKLALLYNNRGHSKYMLVDFYPAKDDFDIALSLNPSLDIAFYNRATIHYRMGDFSAALEDFRMCTKMNPDNLEFAEGLKACQQCLEREK